MTKIKEDSVNVNKLFAVLLGSVCFVYLYTRNLPWLFLWTLGGVAAGYMLKLSPVVSVMVGILVTVGVSWYSIRDHFTNEKLDDQKATEEPAPTGKSTPHVDLGTTILHAYRNLSPEQIGGMKKDTKELMELQKELMGTLAEMKPAIEQGAELLGTFSQFFGSNSAAPA